MFIGIKTKQIRVYLWCLNQRVLPLIISNFIPKNKNYSEA